MSDRNEDQALEAVLTNCAMSQNGHEFSFGITQIFIEVHVNGEVVHVDPVLGCKKRFYEEKKDGTLSAEPSSREDRSKTYLGDLWIDTAGFQWH